MCVNYLSGKNCFKDIKCFMLSYENCLPSVYYLNELKRETFLGKINTTIIRGTKIKRDFYGYFF